MPLPPWPPTSSSDADSLAGLTHLARDYALSHSIVYRPPLDSADFSTSVIHAPFSLFPTPFPKALFQLAQDIQEAYNALYSCIACDFTFLEKVVGGNVAKVDEFQGELWKIAKQVREEGVAQNLHLGLFRSDYLLHHTSPIAPVELKQVEFNTISSSFGALSSKVSELHRYLALTSSFPASNPPISPSSLPPNHALQELASGLASAHKAYLESVNAREEQKQKTRILFVVQDPERNAYDQRALEWELLERHNIPVVRQSFPQLAASASLSSSSARTLSLSLDATSSSTASPSTDKLEISVVYFRAGYTPSDYPSSSEWATRLLLERSNAIKCPSVVLQLAGAKKIQQVLSEPGVLSDLVQRNPVLKSMDAGVWKGVEETFTSLYPMDNSELGKEALQLAREQPERFVLKPQREGGGNNVYRADIPPFLAELEKKDRAAGPGQDDAPKHREGYILMDLIQPPEELKNYLVRAADPEPRLGEVVSELGVYGVTLFRDASSSKSIGVCEILENKRAGHLLRTKGRESDEGGVAVGFSVIDSPLLVED